MKIEWIPGAAVIALVMCGTMFAQDCGCNSHGNEGYVGTGRAPHAWTYEQASNLWAGYCSEQPATHGGLFSGLGCCDAGSASRWPASGSDCGSGSSGCGVNFASRGGLFGGGFGNGGGNGCGGAGLGFGRLTANHGCGCNGGGLGAATQGCGCNGGGFGAATQGCGCNSGGCAGHRHSLDLFSGLRSRAGCGLGNGRLQGLRACGGGCDSGVSSGCGCN